MAILRDRKRTTKLGSAKSGTEDFCYMKVSSMELLILVPLFVFTFGSILGTEYAEVAAYFARPFPAIVAALTRIVSFKHLNDSVQVQNEDSVHGLMEKILIILMACLSYVV